MSVKREKIPKIGLLKIFFGHFYNFGGVGGGGGLFLERTVFFSLTFEYAPVRDCMAGNLRREASYVCIANCKMNLGHTTNVNRPLPSSITSW